MNISKSIVINQPAALVWKVVGEEFEQAHLWMGPVKHSYALDALDQGTKPASAPVSGRVCELGNGPKGLQAEEVISEYNDEGRYLVMDVVPKNAPKLLPIHKNTVKMTVLHMGHNQSKVLFDATPDLKILGKILSPVLKLGLGKAFGDILKDLKKYCELTVQSSAA